MTFPKFIVTSASIFAPETEYRELKRHLADLDEGVEVHRYAPPSQAVKVELKDGGVAIVDQIICSHAR